ncbi:MAG: hypothetical protein LWY06_11305 [Firmicutes bacterium]|nr:hypothetical protein [Bacillota bacterium]
MTGMANAAAMSQMINADYARMQSQSLYGAMAIGAPMMPMQAMPAMGVSQGLNMNINFNLGMGWAGISGGVSGLAGMYSGMGMGMGSGMGVGMGMGVSGMYGQMGMYGGMMGASMMMPGPQAMGMLGMSGMGGMAVMDNTIEVAGTGMGQDKKYKMFPGELMAVNSLLKDGKNVQPDDLKKQLSEKYGIQAEVKDIDGKKSLVNTATGNVLISDGNGNNVLDKGDMKFDDALKQIKEKYGMDESTFEKMYARDQGGTGATTGQNTLMAGGVGAMGGVRGMNGMGMMGFPGMQMFYPFGMSQQSGMMGGYGIWGDPMWQNSLMGVFGGAMNYAGMYGY